MEYDDWFMIATETMVDYLFERLDLDRDLIVVVIANIFNDRKAALRIIGYFYVPEDEEKPKDAGLEAGRELAESCFRYEQTPERVEVVARRWMVNAIYQKWNELRKPRRLD